MAVDVEATRGRVQAYLRRMHPYLTDEDNDYCVDVGTVRVYVRVEAPEGAGLTLIDVWSPFAFDVPVTPDLFEYIAQHAGFHTFGHLEVVTDDEKGTAVVMLRHRLLGDVLDFDEFQLTVDGIAAAADKHDESFVARFGGRIRRS